MEGVGRLWWLWGQHIALSKPLRSPLPHVFVRTKEMLAFTGLAAVQNLERCLQEEVHVSLSFRRRADADVTLAAQKAANLCERPLRSRTAATLLRTMAGVCESNQGSQTTHELTQSGRRKLRRIDFYCPQ